MQAKDYIQNIISLVTILLAVWQFNINRNNKKKELRHQTYFRISELMNLFDRSFAKFLLQQNVNNFNVLSNKINETTLSLSKTEKNMILMKINQSNFSENVNAILKKVEKFKKADVSDAATDELKDDVFKALGYDLYLESDLNMQAIDLEKIRSLKEEIDNEAKKISVEMSAHFLELSTKLDEFILGFNEIDNINITASKKALNQILLVKNAAFTLKLLFNDLQKKHTESSDIFDFSHLIEFAHAQEWKQFQIEKQNLVNILRKEI